MSKIAANIAKVRARLQQAQQKKMVRLLAVSKTQSSSAIREAYAAGIRDFGENYLQEAEQKIDELDGFSIDLPVTWHFIGPLQANKTQAVAEHFQWLHSLDRLKIAQRLSKQRPEGLPPLKVCIQVNIDEEASKSGVSPESLSDLAQQVSLLPNLALRGLMAIPDPERSSNGLKSAFSRMANLFADLQRQFPDDNIDTLSMGMSADMEQAVAAGSTLVRVGTDIFGKRAVN